jgi:hypothetical protein
MWWIIKQVDSMTSKLLPPQGHLKNKEEQGAINNDVYLS